MLTEKETGTVIFALEEYAQVLEKENSYEAKNNVLELIWKIDALSNQGVCDNCDDFYDLGSRDNRCGSCGNCGSCCTHKGEGE
jgi:hypothetical protein